MRPKTAGERNESVMMDKARKEMEKTKDPTEKLRYFNQYKTYLINNDNFCRCFCLSRGASGILGLGR